MLDGISYNPYIRKGSDSKHSEQNLKTNISCQNDCTQYNEISPETSNAIRAYAAAQLSKPAEKFKLYNKNKIPQELFTQEGIKFNTSPDDYIKHLRQQKKNFSIKNIKDKDGREIVQIIERDNGKIKYTSWDYDIKGSNKYSAVVRDICDLEQNKKKQRIVFHENATEIYPQKK
ncbi:hypothetical protein DBY21_05470 [Candidatus Gastranaerophilales bacterium]|nr:MAG: hypothetical protein DBY21_05470 [Candidatus Gastranaerophilales bacterium]